MKIGYGRVSTRDQNPNAQRDALAAAGCEQVFIDKASGKLARRPELDQAADRLALDCWRRLGIDGTYKLCPGRCGALLGWR